MHVISLQCLFNDLNSGSIESCSDLSFSYVQWCKVTQILLSLTSVHMEHIKCATSQCLVMVIIVQPHYLFSCGTNTHSTSGQVVPPFNLWSCGTTTKLLVIQSTQVVQLYNSTYGHVVLILWSSGKTTHPLVQWYNHSASGHVVQLLNLCSSCKYGTP